MCGEKGIDLSCDNNLIHFCEALYVVVLIIYPYTFNASVTANIVA